MPSIGRVWWRHLPQPPEMGLPRDPWRYEIHLDDVVDLSTDEAL